LNPAATRLAAITGRPLVTVFPRYRLGVLSFELGAPIAAATCAQRPDDASRIATQFFEKAVRRDPTTWSRIVALLECEFARHDRATRGVVNDDPRPSIELVASEDESIAAPGEATIGRASS
jgi:hypothetical protein